MITKLREQMGNTYTSPHRLLMALAGPIQFITFFLALWGSLLIVLRLFWSTAIQNHLIRQGKLWVKTKTGNIPHDSIQVLFGVFDRQFWHITRPCWSNLGIYGEWDIMLAAENIVDLPREIFIHGVRGLRPIRVPRQIFPKRQLEQRLLSIFRDSNIESQMPKIEPQ